MALFKKDESRKEKDLQILTDLRELNNLIRNLKNLLASFGENFLDYNLDDIKRVFIEIAKDSNKIKEKIEDTPCIMGNLTWGDNIKTKVQRKINTAYKNFKIGLYDKTKEEILEAAIYMQEVHTMVEGLVEYYEKRVTIPENW